jgi:hypothetical protein
MRKRWQLLFAMVLLLGCQPAAVTPPAASEIQFVFVKIPDPVEPLERGSKYEDPLDEALKKEKVGEVTGGGSQLSKPDETGKAAIEWVGVDVDLTDFEKGLPILKRELLRLGAPPATVVEYERNGKSVEEKLE